MLYNMLIGGAVLTYLSLVYMLMYYIPKFESMFLSLNAKLPGITIAALTASKFIQNNGWFIIPIGLAAIVAIGKITNGDNAKAAVVYPIALMVIFGLGSYGCYLAVQYPLGEISRSLQ